jgi:hypothetical protein
VNRRLAVVPELDRELDDLFARPLSEFTAARNELERRLRRAGQAEAADQVQALKKPSVPLWAANQVARRHPEEVRRLAEAGERLRKAQTAAFRGGDRGAVRGATASERDAIRSLTRLAHELLNHEGRPPTRAVTDRLGSLLRTAAVDPEATRLLVRGRLTEEIEPTGFDALAGMPVPKRAAPKAAGRSDAGDRRRQERVRRLRERRDQLQAKAAEAERQAEAAERAAHKAREAAERARARADRSAADVADVEP